MTEVPVIAGPTAVGKSALALALAVRYGADIISADSRQIYRYLDIGTAKPSPEDLQKVKHHLIDILDPDQSYSAASFVSDARAVMDSLDRQNRRYLVVGGTGLYLRALIEGLSQIPSADEGIRRQLKEEGERNGPGSLYEMLAKDDPESAQRLKPNDNVRIIRALEVFKMTGIPMSQWQRGERIRDNRRYNMLVLNLGREALYRRIETRVDEMVTRGIFQETEDVLKMGYAPEVNAFKTVGYKEAIAFLNGKLGRNDTVNLIKQNTRRYAKRQLTWFRGMSPAESFEIGDNETVEALTERYEKSGKACF